MINFIKDWKYKGFLLHFLLWSGLLLINYIVFGMPGIEFDFSFSLGTWGIYMCFFYLNYSILIPRFLFHNRFLIYIIFLFTAFGANIYLKNAIDSYFFNQIIPNEIRFQPGPFRRNDLLKPEIQNIRPPQNIRPEPSKQFPWFGTNRFLMPGMTQLFLIFLASLSLRFFKKWQDDEKQIAEIEKDKISNELLFLKQQINPHFLFNAINNIYSLSISKSPETSGAIIKLSSILRYMLYETDKKYVELSSEIQAISDYIEIQKLRFTEKVKLQYSVQGNISNHKIVPLIMLPLIENAFKYGVDNANDSFIGILIEIKGNELNLTILNTIISVGKVIENSGIGIKNIRRRLDLLYGNSYTLRNVEEGGIFKVFLKINLE
ncbi:MAG: histidine kinase [Bacteroidales bacterium]